MQSILIILLSSVLLFSCASSKEMAKLKEDLQKKDKAQQNMAVKLAEILDENNDNKFSLMSIKKECKRLRKDSSSLTKAQQKLLEDLMEYQVVNEKLSNNYDELLSNSGNRNQNLIKQLGEKEQALAEKKRLLDEQTNSLSELEKALKSREARVSELENISPSLEPSHAFAEAIKIAPKLKSSEVIIVNSCGDSLKDKDIIKQKLGSYVR